MSVADDVIVDVPRLWSYLPEILAKPCLEVSPEDAKQILGCALKDRQKKEASKDFVTGLFQAAAAVSVSLSRLSSDEHF